jgi:translocation and assembly module TamB
MVSKRKRVWVATALIGLPLIALGIAWVQRVPIAQSVIDDTLKKKGVTAQYEIEKIGTGLQRFENIVIGDPANPDLTAEWAEVDTSLQLFGAEVKAVRAGGVRLRGKLMNGVLNLGAVDKLLPAPTGEPFKFPDLLVDLSDAQIQLQTDYGPISGKLTGKGNLASGFDSQISMAAPQLVLGDCQLTTGSLEGRLLIDARQPSFRGPVSFASGACGNSRVDQGVVTLEAGLSEALDRWSGKAVLTATKLSAPQTALRELSGSIDFAGNRKRTSGTFDLGTASLANTAVTAGKSRASGSFEVAASQSSGQRITSAGTFSGTRIIPDRRLLASVSGLRHRGTGTPLAPIAAALGKAVEGLSRGSAANGRFALEQNDGRGSLTLSSLTGSSVSGARFSLSGAAPVTATWPEGGVQFAGAGQISGGGFPNSLIRMNAVGGIATIDPISVAGSRLSLTPVRFAFGTRGMNLDAIATLDGPLGGGRVSGLRVPLGLRAGRLALGCLPVGFKSLSLSDLDLSPGSIKVCLNGDSAKIGATRLAGRLGSSPITLSAQSARFTLANGDFGVDGLAIRLANGEQPTLLDVPKLTGSLSAGHASGRYSGASGRIGAVPLLLSEASGLWAFAKGAFTTNASLKIADAATDYRFNPVRSDNFALRIAESQIVGGGDLIAPKSGIALSKVSITHNLGRGTGQAILDVPGLRFGQALQPEELTPITLGVIANVQGNVAGRGEINWTPKGVTSSGVFRTDSMDMAAAFGPVQGLSGEIRLSDLLGLETQPGQYVRINAINPGIAVLDGEIRYQLLPGLKTRIEGGRWPFAGGFLILEPTILDLNQAAERRLTFRVEGLDIARFIAAMEFENIAATGTFDGTLPMIFDASGGRIEGGRLVAQSGGTLSYVGEISNENLGTMGRFAFDALKSIKYDRLSVDLDGAIDGDVITRIKFAGVNQAPLSGVRAKLPIPIKVTGLTNIPFIFNVTITAKFRQLFEMARSFNDPSVIINRMLPQLQPVITESPKPVQPPESSPKP